MGIDLHFTSAFVRADGQFTLDIQMQSEARRIGIVGASGCGKSATLKTLAGLMTPNQGHIIIDGEVLFDSAKRINLKPAQRRCGLLFQNYQLFTNMTVAQNIATGLIHQRLVDRWGRSTSPEADRLIASYMELLHINDLAHQPVYHLSGGQQQRVALARMLASDPRIIMLDEPFSAIDAHLKTQLYADLTTLLGTVDKTMLYVTHDIDEVCRFCDWLVVLDQGRIVEMGSRDQILNHPQSLAALKLGGIFSILPAQSYDSSHVCIAGLPGVLCVDEPVSAKIRSIGIAQREVEIIACKPDGHDLVCSSDASANHVVTSLCALRQEDAMHPFDFSHEALSGGGQEACNNLLPAQVVSISKTRHRVLVSCQLLDASGAPSLLPLVTASLPKQICATQMGQALGVGAWVLLRLAPQSIIPVK